MLASVNNHITIPRRFLRSRREDCPPQKIRKSVLRGERVNRGGAWQTFPESSLISQHDPAAESALYRPPVLVCRPLVVDVHDIYIHHLAPCDTPPVVVCYAVGRQIGHLYAYGVPALPQSILAIKDIWCGPCAADVFAIDEDTCALPDIAKVNIPLSGGEG